MAPAERDSLAAAARVLALKVQANDIASLRLLVEPEYDKDPGPMTHLVASVSPKLKDAELVVEQVYLLDATGLKPGIDGKPSDAEFFCSLNKSPAQTDFLIPGLPAGRYGFVIVSGEGTKTPWSLSFLLRQENRSWLMAGFYPKPLTAAGHDGVWYWTQARELASQKRGWNAYLFYHQAQMLLQPVNFISSTNLDKLKKETEAATPPALSEGISANAPLVVKAADGTEYRFTSFTTDDSLGGGQLDVAVHLQADTTGDSDPSAAPAKGKPAPARLSPEARNRNAMSALLAAYPELRSRFHGVWVFADTPGQNPVVTEAAMAEIH
ncbi:MAG TPA: hypothetical protein VNW54_02350 [Granulicella sp.]|nr:hypothetical protein [Granulicella sp.]